VTRDKFLILAVFAILIGSAVAFRLLGGPRPEPAAEPKLAVRPGEYRGISLQLNNGDDNHPYEPLIDEIGATGANTVCLVIHAFQENASSARIFVDRRRGPSDERLEALIRYARSPKSERPNARPALKVVLMPIVLLTNPRENEWRGTIAPSDWDVWWRDYADYITRYAKLAQETGVEVFVIGSELVSTEKHEHAARWRDLIAKVRAAYSGRLSYSANWDHYRKVEWWDQIDIVGMTTYYDLTGGDPPTVERLLAAWEPIREDILKWRAETCPSHPILFTEVGWPNQATCAQYPWDYYRARNRPAPQAQAACFEAFFRTWAGHPAVAGFLVWEWRGDPSWQGGAEDPSYIPWNKPAQKVIEKYYRARPSADSDARTARDGS